MKTLDAHIRQLLSEHDCVILPGLGGFVAARQSAGIRKDTVYPACKSLRFNPALNHNDGLLAQAYMRADSLSFADAAQQMRQDVEALTASLHRNGSVLLPGIGRLSLTGDGHLLFHADAYNRLLAESFGLNPVLCPALASSAKASEPQTAPQAPACPTEGEVTGPKIIPMERWRRLSVTVAAAAAVLLMLCLPLPMGNGDQQWMQQASAIPLPRLEPENVVEATLADAIVAEEEEELGEETPYHLIIGSFRTQHKALQFIKSVPPELQPYILYSDQRYRIAVAAFATEDEGETFLQQFIIARPDYHDAWVLAFQNP